MVLVTKAAKPETNAFNWIGVSFFQFQGLKERRDILSEVRGIHIYPSPQRLSSKPFLESLQKQMQRRGLQYQ